jgi:SMC interacting uncharacterized protein involved in chromosome segregation
MWSKKQKEASKELVKKLRENIPEENEKLPAIAGEFDRFFVELRHDRADAHNIEQLEKENARLRKENQEWEDQWHNRRQEVEKEARATVQAAIDKNSREQEALTSVAEENSRKVQEVLQYVAEVGKRVEVYSVNCHNVLCDDLIHTLVWFFSERQVCAIYNLPGNKRIVWEVLPDVVLGVVMSNEQMRAFSKTKPGKRLGKVLKEHAKWA